MDKEQIEAVSPLAWVVLNDAVNENQVPIEFKDHRFLIQVYSDDSDDLVCKKSAQVGFSVMAILKSMWECQYGGWNVIYALPTNNVVSDFVKPKVNPLIQGNPFIQNIVRDDSVTYKRIGNRSLFFKGGYSERDAISITGDLLIIDEYDRMPDTQVVNTFDSRLQASKRPRRWRFSNPSQVGYGVDGLYNDSDQMHWFIKHSCGHSWYIDFDKHSNESNHYVNQELKIYACGKCGGEITDSERRNGRWIAKYPNRKRRGYWISQLIAPWVSAARILEQKEDSSIEFFYNFVLGKAYTPSDLIVNRETILRACAPSAIPQVNVAMGVDQNASEQIVVAATPQGVFYHNKVSSWEEVEHLKLMWNAVVVCDPAPYPVMPKQLAAKYNDWYLCYFKEQKGVDVLQWKNKVVYADRTRLLDTVANEITDARLVFREKPYELEDYIADWQNLYRTTTETPDGRIKSEWLKKENKESDFSLATAYMRIGLGRLISSGDSTLLEPAYTAPVKKSDIISESGTMTIDLSENIKETLAEL